MKIIPSKYVQTPLGVSADSLDIRVERFALFSREIKVSWSLYGKDTLIKQGFVTLPESLVSNWGTDDTVVKNYVLDQLNLTEDPNP